VALDESHAVHVGVLPERLVPDAEGFERLWSLHPDRFHEVMMHGRVVQTPRWQQAYEVDYVYSGRTNEALDVPELLEPLRDWCRETIEPRLNGILVNWYDAALDHAISRHRDSRRGLNEGAPIVTLSFGQMRVFRMRPWKGTGKVDIELENGAVLVLPYATNLAWTHEVPRLSRHQGRRVSVTLRAFET